MRRKSKVSTDPNSQLQKLDGATMTAMKETVRKSKRPAPRRGASLGEVQKKRGIQIGAGQLNQPIPTKTVLVYKGEEHELKEVGKPKPRAKAAKFIRGKMQVTSIVYQGDTKRGKDEPAMTVDQAKELLGWTIVGYAAKGNEKPEQTLVKFHLKDIHGNKIWLAKCKMQDGRTNRPIRPGLYKRYMAEFLRNKWYLNGDTIVLDENGLMTNGQHRLIAFILADETRRKDPLRYAKYGLGGKGTKTELRYETIVVRGISSAAEVLDTQNLGQKQTGGDVLFRRDYFADQIDSKRRRLSNILSGATRLVWLRCTNKKVSDAPSFPPSEMIDFIEDHPKLIEYCHKLLELEVKTKAGGLTKGGTAGGGITVAYAVGLCYLMAISGTDPDKWKEQGSKAINYKMEAKALKFWEKFASPTNMGDKDPVYNLLTLLPTIDAGSAQGRDELVGMVIKAFNAFADGVEVKSKDLAVRRMRDKKTGEDVLAEDPRLGGIDVEGRPEEVNEDQLDPAKVEETREGTRSGKQWAAGDEAWVKVKDGEHWFGTITEVLKYEDGTKGAILEDVDSGKSYEENLKSLQLSYPGA